MATIEYTKEEQRVTGWALDTGDDGQAFEPRGAGVASAVSVVGLGDSTLTMQASNDGTNWFTVKDLQGNDIALTADGLNDFSSAARYLRPNLTAGTDTGVTVLLSLQG